MGRWMLVALEGQFNGRRFTVPEKGVSFGREVDNDMILDDEKISRRHAIIRQVGDELTIEDLKSRNGTFVNNQKVSKRTLIEGDRIALGASLFHVALAEEGVGPLEAPATVESTVVSVRPRSALARTQAIVVGDGSPSAPPVSLKDLAAAQVEAPRGEAARGEAVRGDAARAEAARVEPPKPEAARADAARTSSASWNANDPTLLPGGAASGAHASLAPTHTSENIASSAPVPDPSIFEEATGVLPSRAILEQVNSLRNAGKVSLGGGTEALRSDAGPVFGGAAAYGAAEVGGMGAAGNPILAPLPMPLPLEPLPGSRAQGGRRTGLIVAVVALLVVGGGVIGVSMQGPQSGADTAGAGGIAVPAPVEAQSEMANVLSGKSASGGAGVVESLLSPEEQALSPADKKVKAQEYLDQGESYYASRKKKEARDEYAKSLALDPGCELCFNRLNRVKSEIKVELERYRTDAKRAFDAMDYTTARRNYEMVLELESDPDGRRAAMDGLKQAKQQLQQQSNR